MSSITQNQHFIVYCRIYNLIEINEKLVKLIYTSGGCDQSDYLIGVKI